ncbi:MAG TPA: hypothetical protein VGF28_17555, partial [Thermoanaerobaculia bacterium]
MRGLLLAAALLLSTAAHAIPVEDYVASLERMHTLIATNQLQAAQAEAAALKDARVQWAGGEFQADSSLIDAVVKSTRAELLLLQRLEVTIAELRGSGAVAATRSDPKLLEQVAAEQEVKELERGGSVTTTVQGEAPLLEQIGGSIAAMFRWLGRLIAKILDWIFDLFPRSQPG